MITQQYFNLLCAALPRDMDPMVFKKDFLPPWWEYKPKEGIVRALRRCPQLDWQAYVANNPDVAEMGSDPVLHFITNGIFEGRRLYARDATEKAIPLAEMDHPKVSIIVYNSNNAAFLKKSIGSLIAQTLQDIEIIVIDDASTDNSLEILHQLNEATPGIVLLKFAQPRGMHIAHRAGVQRASGRFIMFMDSRDFLSDQACEMAYNTIARGFEIVSFRVGYLPSNWFQGISNSAKYGFTNLVDDAGETLRRSSMQDPLSGLRISFQLYDSIYSSELCKYVFENLPEGNANYLQDIIEAIILKISSRNTSQLSVPLYTCFPRERQNAIPALEQSLPNLRKYLEENGYNEYWQRMQDIFLIPLVKEWLAESDKFLVTTLFDTLASEVGIYELLEFILARYSTAWEAVANQFQHYRKKALPCNHPKTIGILYNVLGDGGAERVILDLSHLLAKRSYNVILFLEHPHDNESKLPEEVRTVYLSSSGRCSWQWGKHLMSLGTSLRQHPVDVMLFHNCFIGGLLWQTMLLKYLGIPVIFIYHSSFFNRLLYPGNDFNTQARDAIFRCCDKLTVLSRYDELYFRSCGVDAEYLPNPVRLPDEDETINNDFATRCNNILVFSRLGDPTKNTRGCLHVLAEVLKSNPWIRMTFVGSFANGEGRDNFYSLAEQLGVRDHIQVTGWVQDGRPFIDRSGVLLSCAHHESFALTIVEAQGRGLPAVMNDMPIAPADDNESIIKVEHDNYEAMASEIIELLNDEARWRRLSGIARANARQYSWENYIKKLENLFQTYARQSEVTLYTAEDYIMLIKTLGFYGTNMPPWLRQTAKS